MNPRQKMATLGLIGGTSWRSTIEYYRAINELTNEHFGDNTNPPLVLYNLNQSVMHNHQLNDNWDGIAEILVNAAKRLQNAGAEAIMFCANTPHKVFDIVQREISVPILHIADATANAMDNSGVTKTCLIGTRYSMEEDFLKRRFKKFGIEVLTPATQVEIIELHRIIHEELTFGNVLPTSKRFVIEVIEKMVAAGAKGVVLGCTEFTLMFEPGDLPVPVFDTAAIHAKSALKFVLGENSGVK